MRSSGKTDIGLVRKLNEDSFVCLNLDKTTGSSYEISLYIVADGMGGHNAGEVASSMAVEEIVEYIKNKAECITKDKKDIYELIRNSVLFANDKVYKNSILNSKCLGMGTTLSMALMADNQIYIGHVGDSRIYLVRDNHISKLTEDHSLVAELVKSGTIKPEEAANHPQKNVITRALGTEYTLEVDISHCDVLEGDYYVLCTDGLSNMLEDNEIMNIVTSSKDLDSACDRLINRARDKGGFDNITVVVIQISEDGDSNDR